MALALAPELAFKNGALTCLDAGETTHGQRASVTVCVFAEFARCEALRRLVAEAEAAFEANANAYEQDQDESGVAPVSSSSRADFVVQECASPSCSETEDRIRRSNIKVFFSGSLAAQAVAQCIARHLVERGFAVERKPSYTRTVRVSPLFYKKLVSDRIILEDRSVYTASRDARAAAAWAHATGAPASSTENDEDEHERHEHAHPRPEAEARVQAPSPPSSIPAVSVHASPRTPSSTAAAARELAREHKRAHLDVHTRTAAQRTRYAWNDSQRSPELRAWDDAAQAFVPSLDNATFVRRLVDAGFCGTPAQAVSLRFQCHELANGEFLVYAAGALARANVLPASDTMRAFCDELWRF